jgi:hypothetical protein
MKNVRVAFNVLKGDKMIPVGHQEIQCHVIFNVKVDGLERNSDRMVTGGQHTTEAPKTLTRTSTVSRESIQIILTTVALNDLEVKAADIVNAHLTAPVSERTWMRLGTDFGPEVGKKAAVTHEPCAVSRVQGCCTGLTWLAVACVKQDVSPARPTLTSG